MKKWKYAVVLILLALILDGVLYGIRYANIGAGYNAKMMCSCIFVSGRSQSSIESQDLYAIPFAKQKVDLVNQTVTSNIYGLVYKTAHYRPGLGCTLINHTNLDRLNHQFRTHESISASLADSMVQDTLLQKLNLVIEEAFLEDSLHPNRTRAIVILQNGKKITERYADGITPQTRLIGWSMTKSITNAMVGVLVNKKMIDVYAPLRLKEWSEDERKNITLDDLLRMSSGLHWEEEYTKVSDATKMLFADENSGISSLNKKLIYPPGSHWYYSSGTTNLIQHIIQSKFRSLQEYIDFPHTELFDKIGVSSAVLEPDPSGSLCLPLPGIGLNSAGCFVMMGYGMAKEYCLKAGLLIHPKKLRIPKVSIVHISGPAYANVDCLMISL